MATPLSFTSHVVASAATDRAMSRWRRLSPRVMYRCARLYMKMNGGARCRRPPPCHERAPARAQPAAAASRQAAAASRHAARRYAAWKRVIDEIHQPRPRAGRCGRGAGCGLPPFEWALTGAPCHRRHRPPLRRRSPSPTVARLSPSFAALTPRHRLPRREYAAPYVATRCSRGQVCAR